MGEKLRQLPYRNQPWRVIVICILLNRTQGGMAQPVADEIFRRWPTPELLTNASIDALEDLLRPLGMHRARSNYLRLMSARWSVLGEPQCREEILMLPGCGAYAADAWEIICRGSTAVEPADKELLRYVTFARALAQDTSIERGRTA